MNTVKYERVELDIISTLGADVITSSNDLPGHSWGNDTPNHDYGSNSNSN